MYEIRLLYRDNPKKVFQDFFKGKKIKEFKFIDTYYITKFNNDQGIYFTLRKRVVNNYNKFYFTKYKIKTYKGVNYIENLYKEKKEIFFQNDTVANDFFKWAELNEELIIERELGEVYRLSTNISYPYEITIEKIKDFGFTSEIEFDSLPDLERFIDEDLSLIQRKTACMIGTSYLYEEVKKVRHCKHA